MTMIEPIVRAGTASGPVDPERQVLLAYDRRRDRFVEPRRWFGRRAELLLVTNHLDPDAQVEGVLEWRLPGLDGGAGVEARTRFALACVAGSEERFVRDWVLAGSGTAEERVAGILAEVAPEVDGSLGVEDWLAAFASAVPEHAGTSGALLRISSLLEVEDEGTWWDVVAFAAQGGPTREAEVDLRYVADPTEAPVEGLRRYSEPALRACLRDSLVAALEEHIGPDDPLSRLSASGRAVEAAVEEAARSLGRKVTHFRIVPTAAEDVTVPAATDQEPSAPEDATVGEATDQEPSAPEDAAVREATGQEPSAPEGAAVREATGKGAVRAATGRGPAATGRLQGLSERLEASIDAADRVAAAPRRHVSFEARHPGRCPPGHAHNFLVFAVPADRATLPVGTPLTVALESDGIEVEPARATLEWTGDKLRFPFAVTVDGAVGTQHVVRVSVQLAGIEVARIDRCVLEVSDTGGGKDDRRLETGPLYRRIFVSHSVEDDVAERIAVVRAALGDDAVFDLAALRSGPRWRTDVREAIDEADVFQLLWSAGAAASDACTFEWRRAKKVAALREGFLRVDASPGAPGLPDELGPVQAPEDD